MRCPIFNNNSGMTLIEVIVAMVLVGLVVMSLFAGVTQTSVFSKRIDRVYASSYLAQRRIDILKRFDFDLLDLSEETDVRVGIDGTVDPSGPYSRTTEVYTDYNGNPFLAKVKVSIRTVKVQMTGSDEDPDSGMVEYAGQPVVMETLFADLD